MHTHGNRRFLSARSRHIVWNVAKRESAYRFRINRHWRAWIRTLLAKVSVIDVEMRVSHPRSGINSRRFCKENQSKSSSSASLHSPFSLSLFTLYLFCTCLFTAIHGDLVSTTNFRIKLPSIFTRNMCQTKTTKRKKKYLLRKKKILALKKLQLITGFK
jgi:hypothetical protein